VPIRLAHRNFCKSAEGMLARAEGGRVMEQGRRQGLASQVNRDTSGLIHSAETELRKLGPDTGSNLSSLINRVSQASVSEIEMLIAELQSLRDYLLSEGQRVQREITEYARLNQGAMDSTRIITETLLKWKAGPDRGSRTQ